MSAGDSLLTDFLLVQIEADETWAREASRRGETYVDSGVHWRWEFNDDDAIAVLDPMTAKFVGENSEHGSEVSLRSVETFPTMSVGPLPQFAVNYAQEVPVAVAGHIVRWDPARVLAECEAKRRIVKFAMEMSPDSDLLPEFEGERSMAVTLRALAQPYRDRDGYSPAWDVG